MKFVAMVSSFLLDAAAGLIGAAFIGASAMMFVNDIKAVKAKKEAKQNENGVSED